MCKKLRFELINHEIDESKFKTRHIEDAEEKYEERIKYIKVSNLNDEEKERAIKNITNSKDVENLLELKREQKDPCKKCHRKGYTIGNCEHCLRDHLRKEFPNWTSGNSIIDDEIEASQMKLPLPGYIMEWIPPENLTNKQYKTKGGFAEIYTATWETGFLKSFDKENERFVRFGKQAVVLKEMLNSVNSNLKFLEELKMHLRCQSYGFSIVPCLGISANPKTNDFILVMAEMERDLANYIFQNRSILTWRMVYDLFWYISSCLFKIHSSGFVHCDLHPGNILCGYNGGWFISDLGLCGLPEMAPTSVYGNLPFIATEVITGREVTSAADVYSFGMLMYQVVAGKPPFHGRQHDVHLIFEILDGERPAIPDSVPDGYKNLMKQCWDTIPQNRPTTEHLARFFYNECKRCSIEEMHGSRKVIQDAEESDTSTFTSQSSSYDTFPNHKPKNSEEIVVDSHESSLALPLLISRRQSTSVSTSTSTSQPVSKTEDHN